MIGTQEIVIIVIIALIVFGPQKMPEIGRQIGQMMREFRKMSGDVQSALNFDDDHNRYDNGYNKAYNAEPPGPAIEAPRHGDTYAMFPANGVAENTADDVNGASSKDAYTAADGTYDYHADHDDQGARIYSAPDAQGSDAEGKVGTTEYTQTSDAAQTTNHVSVANGSSGGGH